MPGLNAENATEGDNAAAPAPMAGVGHLRQCCQETTMPQAQPQSILALAHTGGLEPNGYGSNAAHWRTCPNGYGSKCAHVRAYTIMCEPQDPSQPTCPGRTTIIAMSNMLLKIRLTSLPWSGLPTIPDVWGDKRT